MDLACDGSCAVMDLARDGSCTVINDATWGHEKGQVTGIKSLPDLEGAEAELETVSNFAVYILRMSLFVINKRKEFHYYFPILNTHSRTHKLSRLGVLEWTIVGGRSGTKAAAVAGKSRWMPGERDAAVVKGNKMSNEVKRLSNNEDMKQWRGRGAAVSWSSVMMAECSRVGVE